MIEMKQIENGRKVKKLLVVSFMLAMVLFFIVPATASWFKPINHAKKCSGVDCDKTWTTVMDPDSPTIQGGREVRYRCGSERINGERVRYCIYKIQEKTCNSGHKEKACWELNKCSVTGGCETGAFVHQRHAAVSTGVAGLPLDSISAIFDLMGRG